MRTKAILQKSTSNRRLYPGWTNAYGLLGYRKVPNILRGYSERPCQFTLVHLSSGKPPLSEYAGVTQKGIEKITSGDDDEKEGDARTLNRFRTCGMGRSPLYGQKYVKYTNIDPYTV